MLRILVPSASFRLPLNSDVRDLHVPCVNKTSINVSKGLKTVSSSTQCLLSNSGAKASFNSDRRDNTALAGDSNLVLSTTMKPRANQFGLLRMHQPATPVLIGPQGIVPGDRRLMRVPGRSCCSLVTGAGGLLSGAFLRIVFAC